MSWNFGMTADLGGKHPIDLDYDRGYTFNVAKMFYDAFDLDDGIRGLHGKTGEECIPLLKNAIKNFISKRELYESWNPPNRWGNYDGALELLNDLLGWCIESPKAEMYVS